jgi:hypothetical protein
LEQFIKFKACKSEKKLTLIGLPIWLSGYPEKGNFNAKNPFLVFLALKSPFSG